MRLVLVASITGQDVRACLDHLTERHGPRAVTIVRGERPLTVEDYLVAAANPFLKRLRTEPKKGYSLADVLLLPVAELTEVCGEAFQSALTEIATLTAPSDATRLLAFHPVLYHQLTREFVAPYQADRIASDAVDAGLTVVRVVSIHDDIFDVHRRLLAPGRLFEPSTTRRPRVDSESGQAYFYREPLRDLQELRLILDWRCRELMQSKAIAAGLAARHFLFHQKGHLDALWKVAGEERASAYFSHPISQPRRDILGKADPVKCKVPDASRGRELRRGCQQFSSKLRTLVPTVEPTAIDELRLDPTWLAANTDKALERYVLPPLSERWPLNDGPHLGGSPPEDLHATPLLPVSQAVFADVRPEGIGLANLAAAMELLSEEILRQINVRDHSLAEQCDMVVAFRPFSVPDSPEPTGGVKKEMDVVQRKVALGKKQCRPALFVIHPYSDEQARRGKEFDREWEVRVAELFTANQAQKLAEFKIRARDLLVNAPYEPDHSALAKSLAGLMVNLGLAVRPPNDDASMASGGYGRADEARAEFIESLIEKTSILRSFLHRSCADKKISGFIKLVDADKPSQELMQEIKRAADLGPQGVENDFGSSRQEQSG